MLIGARFVQGAGGALTSAVVLGMIVTMFPEPREQAKAIGVYGFVASAGGSIGLLAGGVLTEAISWHWIFFINVPVGIATAVLARRLVAGPRGDRPARGRRPPRRRGPHRRAHAGRVHDPPGRRAGLGIDPDARASAPCPSRWWLASWCARRASPTPLMPLRLFRARNAVGANLVMALLVAGMFAMFFLGALYLQRVLGYDPLEVGLAFLPSTIVMGTISLRYTERLNMRFGAKATLLPGIVSHLGSGCCCSLGRPSRGTTSIDVVPAVRLHRPRCRPELPVADDACDVRRNPQRRRAGVGAGQRHGAGGRARSAWPCWPRFPPSAPPGSSPRASRWPRR